MNSTDEILVSIITVCYNAADSIEKTIISVLNQSYINIEYIIVDGKSTDGTIDIVKKYENKISKIISEADNGIYDAMNKGVKHTHGEWIYFLNSGDFLFNDDVVQNVINSHLKNRNASIIYGDIIVYDHSTFYSQEMYKPTSFHVMTRGGIYHQAIFAKKELFQQTEPFEPNYRVFADYNWLLNSIYVYGAELSYIAQPIAFYQMNGYSQKNFKKHFPERLEIVKNYLKYYNLRSVLYNNISEILYFGIFLIYLRLPMFSRFFEFSSKISKNINKKFHACISRLKF